MILFICGKSPENAIVTSKKDKTENSSNPSLIVIILFVTH